MDTAVTYRPTLFITLPSSTKSFLPKLLWHLPQPTPVLLPWLVTMYSLSVCVLANCYQSVEFLKFDSIIGD